MGVWERLGDRASLCWRQWKAPAGSSSRIHWFISLSSTRLATATTPLIIADNSQCPARLGFVPRNRARDKNRHPLNTENRGNREFIKSSAWNSSLPPALSAAVLREQLSCQGWVLNPSQFLSDLQEWGFYLVSWYIPFLCLYRIYRNSFFTATTTAEFWALSSSPAAPQSPHPPSWNSSLSDTSLLPVRQRKEKRELRYSKSPSSVNSDWIPSAQTSSRHTFN